MEKNYLVATSYQSGDQFLMAGIEFNDESTQDALILDARSKLSLRFYDWKWVKAEEYKGDLPIFHGYQELSQEAVELSNEKLNQAEKNGGALFVGGALVVATLFGMDYFLGESSYSVGSGTSISSAIASGGAGRGAGLNSSGATGNGNGLGGIGGNGFAANGNQYSGSGNGNHGNATTMRGQGNGSYYTYSVSSDGSKKIERKEGSNEYNPSLSKAASNELAKLKSSLSKKAANELAGYEQALGTYKGNAKFCNMQQYKSNWYCTKASKIFSQSASAGGGIQYADNSMSCKEMEEVGKQPVATNGVIPVCITQGNAGTLLARK